MFCTYLEGLTLKEYFGSHFDHLKLFIGDQEYQECKEFISPQSKQNEQRGLFIFVLGVSGYCDG